MRIIKLYVKSTSLLGKTFGLIGKSKPETLLIKTHFGIHTFGLRFPIDVVILNKKQTVVALKEHLLPNRVFFWNPLFDTILELPDNTIKNYIRLGDTIEFINEKM